MGTRKGAKKNGLVSHRSWSHSYSWCNVKYHASFPIPDPVPFRFEFCLSTPLKTISDGHVHCNLHAAYLSITIATILVWLQAPRTSSPPWRMRTWQMCASGYQERLSTVIICASGWNATERHRLTTSRGIPGRSRMAPELCSTTTAPRTTPTSVPEPQGTITRKTLALK